MSRLKRKNIELVINTLASDPPPLLPTDNFNCGNIILTILETYLGGVDELIGEALGDGLNVPEGRLPGPGAQQPDSLYTNQGQLWTETCVSDLNRNCGRPRRGSEEA